MTNDKSTSRPYHHGHLKEALVDAAEALLVEQGLAKLSLRSVARRSGVSPTAPYAHFDGREALLAAVATRGFDRLAQQLRKAERRQVAGLGVIGRLARAYVAFALQSPMLFRLMFGTDLSGIDDPALRASGEASFAPIQEAVALRAREVGMEQWAGEASLAAWSLVHGLATLIVDGKQPWPANAAARNALVDRVASVFSVDAMGDGH